MNVIACIKFEQVYFEADVKYFNYYVSLITPARLIHTL